MKRREEVERREGRKGKEVNWEGKEGMGRNYRTGEGKREGACKNKSVGNFSLTDDWYTLSPYWTKTH